MAIVEINLRGSLLPQEDSHGCFLITESKFRTLIAPHNMLPQFFESMGGFGYRTRDGEDCGTYSRRVSESPAGIISGICQNPGHQVASWTDTLEQSSVSISDILLDMVVHTP
jgi:hypothetical protein